MVLRHSFNHKNEDEQNVSSNLSYYLVEIDIIVPLRASQHPSLLWSLCMYMCMILVLWMMVRRLMSAHITCASSINLTQTTQGATIDA